MRAGLQLVAGVGLVLLGAAAEGGKPPKEPPPPLSREHTHASGAFSFRTPESWQVESSPTDQGALQAAGDGVLLRFLYRAGEQGYDSLHVTCMMERLAAPMDSDPRVRYQYDHVSMLLGERRALDSAFEVRYDAPVLGHREWRQRNLTIVGQGQSLCVIAHAPLPLWKKSAETRSLLDAVVASLKFH
jgi:hypothetical protein